MGANLNFHFHCRRRRTRIRVRRDHFVFFCFFFFTSCQLSTRAILRESTVRKRMATGTFTCNSLRAKRAYKNTKKNCRSLKFDKNNAVSIGTPAVKQYVTLCPVGLVWFSRYCGKMYSCHPFSYGALATVVTY